MPPTVDELLAALPDVGLRLWMLDQCDANWWHASLCESASPTARFEADAATPGDALAAALAKAGVNISDDEAPF